MKLRTRLQRLQRQVAALAALRPHEVPDDDEFETWCRGGCLGPLPSAGPRPSKFYSDEEWQCEHRFLLVLCCRSVGKDDPPGMNAEERRQVDDTTSFFASIDPNGELSLPQQARLAPYTDAIVAFQNDPRDETIAAIPHPGESPCA